jgi:hypothetical protein
MLHILLAAAVAVDMYVGNAPALSTRGVISIAILMRSPITLAHHAISSAVAARSGSVGAASPKAHVLNRADHAKPTASFNFIAIFAQIP